MSEYIASSQKLWRISQEVDGYYYEIKLYGQVLDRIRIEEPALHLLKEKGLI